MIIAHACPQVLGFAATRWLWRGACTIRVIVRYKSILTDLQWHSENAPVEGRAVARSLFDRMRQDRWLRFLLLFADIMGIVDGLCKLLQTEDLDISSFDDITSHICALRSLRGGPGPWEQKYDELRTMVHKEFGLNEGRGERQRMEWDQQRTQFIQVPSMRHTGPSMILRSVRLSLTI